MKRWLKKWLKHLAWKKERQNQCVIDFRGLEVEGVDALKRAQESPVAILAPIENCRSLHDAAFSFGANCFDPYFMTANQIINNGDISYKRSWLSEYFEKVQPVSAAQLLDVYNERLLDIPAMCSVVPWRGAIDLTGKIKHRRKKSCGELQDGWNVMGPLSDEQGALELERLRRTISSINACGFDDKFIKLFPNAEVLVRNDEERYMLRDGSHRIATARALGFSKVPIVVDSRVRIICKSDAQNWPSVKNKAISLFDAEHVFDRIFEGRQPRYIEDKWMPAYSQQFQSIY